MMPHSRSRSRRTVEVTERDGDIEHRADLAQAAERDAEVMQAIGARTTVAFAEVEPRRGPAWRARRHGA
jgi:hypothetical protein